VFQVKILPSKHPCLRGSNRNTRFRLYLAYMRRTKSSENRKDASSPTSPDSSSRYFKNAMETQTATGLGGKKFLGKKFLGQIVPSNFSGNEA